MLEVCVDSLESATTAVNAGADELEVCSSLLEGGLTPSAGLLKQVLKLVNDYAINNSGHKPKVNVMIRCRAGSDFCYTKSEMDTMLEDIDIFHQLKVDRFVFGSLKETRRVDDVNCSKVLAQAYPKQVTFHRAFDMCDDPKTSIEEIIQLGFTRVLTSGQRASVGEKDAVALIKELIKKYGNKIEIMPGAGLNADNARQFIDMGCKIVHSSCKKVRSSPMGAGGEGDKQHIVDGEVVKEIKRNISA